ncbi:MAG: ABC transporter substrate-binding protein [Nitrososphaerales archaeon]
MQDSHIRNGKSGITTMVAIVAIVVVLVVAGAGGYLAGARGASTVTQTVTSTVSGTVSGTNLDPASQLACANQEGKVTIYGLVDTPAWNQFIAPAWAATYPNIKMSYLGTDSGTLLNKALAEHKAGQVQSDVLETFVNAIYALNQSGAIQPWLNPEEAIAGYTASALDPGNYFHPFTDYITTPAYNTKLLSQSQLPTTWNQLLTSPAFSGKFAYSKPAVLGTGAGIMYGLSTYESMTYPAWVSFMKQAAANNPVATEDDGGSMTDVITGQVPIGIGGTNDIQAAQAANGTLYAPLWLNPVFVSRVPIAISQGAPDPCAAKLFTEWATSLPGQLAVGASLRTPALPQAAQLENNILLNPPANATLFYYDTGQYINNVTGLSNLFTSIFGA